MITLLDVCALSLSVFGMVTIPLYIALLHMFYKERRKTFTGPFYRLFIVLGVLDILSTINNFLGVSLPGWGISIFLTKSHGYIYSRFYMCIAWFTRVNQGMSSVLIALNRAYALMAPIRYVSRSHKFKWQYFVQTIPGLIFATGAAVMDSDYVYYDNRELRQATPRILNEYSRRVIYLTGGFCQIFQIIALVAAYIICIVKLTAKKPTQEISHAHTGNNHSERSATYLGLCICTAELINFAYMIFSNCFKTEAATYFSIHSSMTDLYSLANCYFVIFFSKSVRRKLWLYIVVVVALYFYFREYVACGHPKARLLLIQMKQKTSLDVTSVNPQA